MRPVNKIFTALASSLPDAHKQARIRLAYYGGENKELAAKQILYAIQEVSADHSWGISEKLALEVADRVYRLCREILEAFPLAPEIHPKANVLRADLLLFKALETIENESEQKTKHSKSLSESLAAEARKDIAQLNQLSFSQFPDIQGPGAAYRRWFTPPMAGMIVTAPLFVRYLIEAVWLDIVKPAADAEQERKRRNPPALVQQVFTDIQTLNRSKNYQELSQVAHVEGVVWDDKLRKAGGKYTHAIINFLADAAHAKYEINRAGSTYDRIKFKSWSHWLRMIWYYSGKPDYLPSGSQIENFRTRVADMQKVIFKAGIWEFKGPFWVGKERDDLLVIVHPGLLPHARFKHAPHGSGRLSHKQRKSLLPIPLYKRFMLPEYLPETTYNNTAVLEWFWNELHRYQCEQRVQLLDGGVKLLTAEAKKDICENSTLPVQHYDDAVSLLVKNGFIEPTGGGRFMPAEDRVRDFLLVGAQDEAKGRKTKKRPGYRRKKKAKK